MLLVDVWASLNTLSLCGTRGWPPASAHTETDNMSCVFYMIWFHQHSSWTLNKWLLCVFVGFADLIHTVWFSQWQQLWLFPNEQDIYRNVAEQSEGDSDALDVFKKGNFLPLCQQHLFVRSQKYLTFNNLAGMLHVRAYRKCQKRFNVRAFRAASGPG